VSLRFRLQPRFIVLSLLWLLPGCLYLAIGLFALYQTGWLKFVALSLPIVWFVSWAVARWWKPSSAKIHALAPPIKGTNYWTDRDTQAIRLVDEYRRQLPPLDYAEALQWERYVRDARGIAAVLTEHYHRRADQTAVANVTLVELLTVIHLAAEDLERWVQRNVPGSGLLQFKHLHKVPMAVKAADWLQTGAFVATVLFNPIKAASYPLWRMSGRVVSELQLEILQAFYQHYLQQIGFYLIEMYSGRLRGGSEEYHRRFRKISQVRHAAKGDDLLIPTADVSIAVMGQVKAGKSSLINRLLQGKVAETSVLPQTREVSAYSFGIEGTDTTIRLLDTPGYAESGTDRRQQREIEKSSERADVILLVMAAHSAARHADVEAVRHIQKHYREQRHLQQPVMLGILTHADLLRPVGIWDPPYNWRNPSQPKEFSMHAAVDYVRETFGGSLRGVACVCTSDEFAEDSGMADEVIPLLLNALPEAKAASMLRSYYQQISDRRLRELKDQVGGLLVQVVERLLAH
jgi:uncharacterized protein